MNAHLVFHGFIVLLIYFVAELLKNLRPLFLGNNSSFSFIPTDYKSLVAGIWLVVMGGIYEKLSILSPFYTYICLGLIVAAYLTAAATLLGLFTGDENVGSSPIVKLRHFLWISAIILNIISIAELIFATLTVL